MSVKPMTSKAVVAKCKSLCKSRGIPSVAKNYSRYFKGVVELRGLKAPAVDQIFKEVQQMADVSSWETDRIFVTGLALLSGKFQEEKRLGVLFLKKCRSDFNVVRLERLAHAIEVHVYDWATCDILAGGVVRWAIESDSAFVPRLIEWSTDTSIWKRRCCCVSFLSFARRGEYDDAIETICDQSVRMNERFVQLGVGWLLREYSCSNLKRMLTFLETHPEWISREGLRYALEKVDPDIRKKQMDYHKEQNSKKAN